MAFAGMLQPAVIVTQFLLLVGWETCLPENKLARENGARDGYLAHFFFEKCHFLPG